MFQHLRVTRDRANESNPLSLQYGDVPVCQGHRLTRYIIYPDGSLRHKQNSQTFSFLLWNLAVNPSAEGHALPLSYRGMQWFLGHYNFLLYQSPGKRAIGKFLAAAPGIEPG